MIWHYTTKDGLVRILRAGHLKLTPRELRPPEQVRGVWFTTSEIWEPTATKQFGVQTGDQREMLGVLDFHTLRAVMGIARVGYADEFPGLLTFSQFECQWLEHALFILETGQRIVDAINWTEEWDPATQWRFLPNHTVSVEVAAKVQILNINDKWEDV